MSGFSPKAPPTMFQFSWWEKSDIFMILYQRVLIVSICCPGPIMKPHSQATHPRLLVKEIMLGAFCSCGLAHCGRSLIEQQYHTMSGWMFLHVWHLCFLRPALHNIYLVSTKRVYWHLYFGSLLCISRATMIASTGPEVGCLTMWFVLCKLQSEARIWGLDSCAHIRGQSLCCWAKTWQAELGKRRVIQHSSLQWRVVLGINFGTCLCYGRFKHFQEIIFPGVNPNPTFKDSSPANSSAEACRLQQSLQHGLQVYGKKRNIDFGLKHTEVE